MSSNSKTLARVRAYAVGLMAIALLAACGGGGGDAPPQGPTPIPDNLAITAPSTAQMASAVQFSQSAGSTPGLRFRWDFGDGSANSTEASPSHSYPKVGEYEVALNVSNEAGVSRDLKFKLTINNQALVRGLQCSGPNETGWCASSPVPPLQNRTSASFFIDGRVGWRSAYYGGIFKTTNGGETWVRQTADGSVGPYPMIKFIDANTGFVLSPGVTSSYQGSNGSLLRTTDGGATWLTTDLGADIAAPGTAVFHADAQALILTQARRHGSDSVRASVDGGKTWRVTTYPATRSDTVSIFTIGKDRTVWRLNGGVLYKSGDLGVSEAQVLDIGPLSTYDTVSLTLLDDGGALLSRYGASAADFKLLRSRDGGTSWQTLAPQGLPADGLDNRAHLVAGGNTLLLATTAGVYRSVDAGEHWARVNTVNSKGSYLDSFIYLGNAAYLRKTLSADGSGQYDLRRSLDDGLSWTLVASPPDADVAVSGTQLDAQTLVLNTSRGGRFQSYRSTDLGHSWTAMAIPGDDPDENNIDAFWAFDAKRLLSANRKGQLRLSNDGGRSWELKLSGLQDTVVRLQFVSDKVGWMQLNNGTLYRSNDGGLSWSAALPIKVFWKGFQFLDENTGWAVDDARRVMQTFDGGLSWTATPQQPPALTRSIRFHSRTNGLAVGAYGIAETRDGGQSWTNTFSVDPRYYPLNAIKDAVYADAMHAWALGIYGDFLRSSDGGRTWENATSNVAIPPPGNAWWAIQFLDAKRGWASSEAVYATIDGGRTWIKQSGGGESLQFVDSMTGWSLSGGVLLITGTGGF